MLEAGIHARGGPEYYPSEWRVGGDPVHYLSGGEYCLCKVAFGAVIDFDVLRSEGGNSPDQPPALCACSSKS